MRIQVLLFAQARELVGSPQCVVSLNDGATVRDLRLALSQEFPQLAPLMPQLFVAINQQFSTDSDIIVPSAEVACFPPVSGG